ncbi:hypothetical protein QTP81_04900 [Alteromonas sp. ASW11-36]|uniref:CopL family metal-binding regulatory protein n=1 Tax=Alteromonas arenosi TaxID=3055817 RepID=A0ABT7SUR6_9ALTE|nr:hypothetical protein [Alteromonas sp. ASW11-36]MDM7859933.1 hypothetical protein [Alteromonas sp. ASW11-36]
MPKQLATIVMMLTLLITQISGAFAPVMAFSLTPDMPCSMHLAPQHSSQSGAHAESLNDTHMAKSKMSESTISEHGMSMEMDCCDTDDVNVCCDGQCGCFAFAATYVFIQAQFSDEKMPSTNDAIRHVSSPPHSAFSALLIRPPIQFHA